jgi:hypothetical protein
LLGRSCLCVVAVRPEAAEVARQFAGEDEPDDLRDHHVGDRELLAQQPVVAFQLAVDDTRDRPEALARFRLVGFVSTGP